MKDGGNITKFKKISWIYEMSEIYLSGNLSTKRLEEISEESRNKLIYSVIHTLAQYFGGMYHYVDGLSPLDPEYNKKCQATLSIILPIWLSGLCDVSAAQIINGLLDILDLKTEYQKWPPKNVIEFHAVCKMYKPAYYDTLKESNNSFQLGWDKEAARANSIRIAGEELFKIREILNKARARTKPFSEEERKQYESNYFMRRGARYVPER